MDETLNVILFTICSSILALLIFYLYVIIKPSEERTLRPQVMMPMVSVFNPFAFLLDGSKSTLRDGVIFKLSAQENCTIFACWGVLIEEIYKLTYEPWDKCYETFKQEQSAKEALLRMSLEVSDKHIDTGFDDNLTIKPSSTVDLGKVPRARYPLALIFVNKALQGPDVLSCSCNHVFLQVVFVHLPDNTCPASSHVIGHFVRTPFAAPCHLQALYVSGEPEEEPVNTTTSHDSHRNDPHNDAEKGPSESQTDDTIPEASEDFDKYSSDRCENGSLRVTCVVCQCARVARALLPCRHVCVCEDCFPRLQNCPVCRAFIVSSFRLVRDQRDTATNGTKKER